MANPNRARNPKRRKGSRYMAVSPSGRRRSITKDEFNRRRRKGLQVELLNSAMTATVGLAGINMMAGVAARI